MAFFLGWRGNDKKTLKQHKNSTEGDTSHSALFNLGLNSNPTFCFQFYKPQIYWKGRTVDPTIKYIPTFIYKMMIMVIILLLLLLLDHITRHYSCIFYYSDPRSTWKVLCNLHSDMSESLVNNNTQTKIAFREEWRLCLGFRSSSCWRFLKSLTKFWFLKQRDNCATCPQLLFGLADPKEAKVCLLR